MDRVGVRVRVKVGGACGDGGARSLAHGHGLACEHALVHLDWGQVGVRVGVRAGVGVGVRVGVRVRARCEHALIHRGAALAHHRAVDRHALARLDEHDLAHHDLVERLLHAALQGDRLREQAAQPARLLRGVVHAPLLDPLREHEEEDNGCRLEEVAQHERAHLVRVKAGV